MPKVLDLNDLIGGVDRMVRRILGGDVELGEAGNGSLGDASAKSRTPELESMRTRIRGELLAGHANGVKETALPKS